MKLQRQCGEEGGETSRVRVGGRASVGWARLAFCPNPGLACMNTSNAPHTGQDSQDIKETKVTIFLHHPLKQREDPSA